MRISFHCLSGRLGLIMGLLFFQLKNFNGNGILLLMDEDQFSLLEWETWTNHGSIKKFLMEMEDFY